MIGKQRMHSPIQNRKVRQVLDADPYSRRYRLRTDDIRYVVATMTRSGSTDSVDRPCVYGENPYGIVETFSNTDFTLIFAVGLLQQNCELFIFNETLRELHT